MNDDSPHCAAPVSLAALLLAFASAACSSTETGAAAGSTSGGDASATNRCAAGHVVTVAEPSPGNNVLYGVVLLDATNVYWTEQHGASEVILTAPKTGGAASVVASYDIGGVNAHSLDKIAVDDANLYVATAIQNSSKSSIEAVPKSGGPAQVLVPETGLVTAIAASQDHVCWIESGELRSVPKKGGMPTTLTDLVDAPSVLAADSDRIYWVGRSAEKSPVAIQSMPPFGGASTALATGHDVRSFALDDTRLYWNDNGGTFGAGSVMAVAKSGGTPTTIAGDGKFIWSVAVAGSCVYWTENGSSNRVMAAPMEGGEAAILVEELGLGDVAADESGAYWPIVEAGTFKGKISKLAK